MRKNREEHCVTALEWRPEERRRPRRPKTTWRRMVEDERRVAGWQTWMTVRSGWKEDVKALNLKWSKHVQSTTGKASKVLGMMKRNLWNCPKRVRETAYTAIVRPKLEYIHTYIHTLLYLPSDFRVAYAANISEHLAIRREIDHRTGNYVPYTFRTVCGFFYVPQN